MIPHVTNGSSASPESGSGEYTCGMLLDVDSSGAAPYKSIGLKKRTDNSAVRGLS